jgi:hypothetical protein
MASHRRHTWSNTGEIVAESERDRVSCAATSALDRFLEHRLEREQETTSLNSVS